MLAPVAAARALAVLLAAQRLGLGFDGRVQVTSPSPLPVLAQGELSVTILDTPVDVSLLSVRLSAAEVVLPENRLGARDIVDPQASQPRVRARFVAPAVPGRYEVEGLVEYVTCDAERCRPRRSRVVWVVEVTELPGDETLAGRA
ncbi:MAG: hypothetical protein AAGF11_46395 [Myxococcota bacterium]